MYIRIDDALAALEDTKLREVRIGRHSGRSDFSGANPVSQHPQDTDCQIRTRISIRSLLGSMHDGVSDDRAVPEDFVDDARPALARHRCTDTSWLTSHRKEQLFRHRGSAHTPISTGGWSVRSHRP